MDVAPDATVLPATVTVAPVSVVLGENVTDETPFTILMAYEIVPDANAGLSVPALTSSAESVATLFV